jgi:hypothetical protein
MPQLLFKDKSEPSKVYYFTHSEVGRASGNASSLRLHSIKLEEIVEKHPETINNLLPN